MQQMPGRDAYLDGLLGRRLAGRGTAKFGNIQVVFEIHMTTNKHMHYSHRLTCTKH